MPSEDSDRWDARYREEIRFSSFEKPRPFLTGNTAYLPPGGLALDLAMGLGGNSSFLIEKGYQVVGVDVSFVALQRAKRRMPGLMAVHADLTRFYLPPNTFDLILNFYYLQRDLWGPISQSLRPGGVLVYETLTRDMLSIHPEVDPVYLLAPGELSRAFPDLEQLVYQEGWTESDRGYKRAVASLLARKPAPTNQVL